jgi:hypothetical protein
MRMVVPGGLLGVGVGGETEVGAWGEGRKEVEKEEKGTNR